MEESYYTHCSQSDFLDRLHLEISGMACCYNVHIQSMHVEKGFTSVATCVAFGGFIRG